MVRSSSFFLVFLAFLALPSALLATYTPTTRTYYLVVSPVTLSPDGVSRIVYAINGSIEGPVLRATVGDTLQVTVLNNISESISLHFHGMYQNGTNHEDGSPPVTQCPIPTGTTFTYSFSVPNQWGTYWYHSHFQTNYGDGIRGPLIIDPIVEPYSYDGEIIVTLADWYHNITVTYLPGFFENIYNGEPVPDSALISGRGQANCTSVIGVCDPSSPQTSYAVVLGKTYRVRFINMAVFAMFEVSIDSHVMNVIEVDGTDTLLTPVDYLPINVAQRISVLVNATDPLELGNYWLRATMVQSDFDTICPMTDSLAIFHYSYASLIEPDTENLLTNESTVDWINWVPYNPSPAPSPVTHNFTLALFIDGDNNVAYLNNISFTPLPTYNTLEQVILGWNAEDFPVSHHALAVNALDVVEIVLNNEDDGEHPFHLHGQKVWVLGRGSDQPFDYAIHGGLLNYDNPIMRDTVSVEGDGWIVMRFVANNPGCWMFHCHIQWHMNAGLAAVFIVNAPAIRSQYPQGLSSLPSQMPSWCSTNSTTTTTTSTSSSSTSGAFLPSTTSTSGVFSLVPSTFAFFVFAVLTIYFAV